MDIWDRGENLALKRDLMGTWEEGLSGGGKPAGYGGGFEMYNRYL